MTKTDADMQAYAKSARLWMDNNSATAYNAGLSSGILAIMDWLSWHGEDDAVSRINWYIHNKLPNIQVKLDVPNE